MHTTHAPRKTERGFTITLAAPKRGNLLSIEAQIKLKAQAKRHDKSKSRAKQKRQWQGE